ncbi:MAG: DUF922 domain-containing protein [Niabella sp.]
MKRFFSLWMLSVIALTMHAQKNKAAILYWQPDYVLQLTDFIIVADDDSKIKNHNQAITRTGITYSLTSNPATRSFTVQLYATMHRKFSYIKKGVLKVAASGLENLLSHEQLHFDISELYARKAVRALSSKKFSKNYAKEINLIVQEFFNQAKQYQIQYDTETANGTNKTTQQDWNDRIRKQLQETEQYLNKTVTGIY